ncbi:unnamed protein product, partial [Amoebophrya sp. A25]|eukprot:GSA25T00022588001.1
MSHFFCSAMMPSATDAPVEEMDVPRESLKAAEAPLEMLLDEATSGCPEEMDAVSQHALAAKNAETDRSLESAEDDSFSSSVVHENEASVLTTDCCDFVQD